MIVHLNGMPGVGKLTIARIFKDIMDAKLIDNHSIIDLICCFADHGSPHYIDAFLALNAAVMDQLMALPDDQIIVFTNALASELPEDIERFNLYRDFAKRRGVLFVPVHIDCDLDENKKRLLDESRKEKGKLKDPAVLENIVKNYSIYHPKDDFPNTQYRVDATHQTAAESAQQIAAHIQRLKR